MSTNLEEYIRQKSLSVKPFTAPFGKSASEKIKTVQLEVKLIIQHNGSTSK